MKKILLATTALMISAAAANAQAVQIGGEGRMGLLWERTTFGALSSSEWAQENRFQMNFSVTVQADHGLSFGAFSRVRITNGATGSFSGSRVWVEASNLRLTFGNVDGAIRGAGTSHGYAGGCGIGYVGGHYCADTSGLLGLSTLGLARTLYQGTGIMPGQTQGFASIGGGPAARARLDYTFGSTRVALSHDRGGSTEFGVRSTFDAFTVALGFANRASHAVLGAPIVSPGYFTDNYGSRQAPGSVVSLSGHYNGGSWGVGAQVVRIRYSEAAMRPGSHTNWTLSGNVELGGGNLYGFIGRVAQARSNAANVWVGPNRQFNTMGINYAYGLGGGATLHAGVERISASAIDAARPAFSATSASVGVAFNF